MSQILAKTARQQCEDGGRVEGPQPSIRRLMLLLDGSSACACLLSKTLVNSLNEEHRFL